MSVTGRRLHAVIPIALTAAVLQGCVAGMAAVSAVPYAIGSVAIVGAEDRSPFRSEIPPSQLWTKDIAILNERMRLADCGNAESQFWLASTMDNGFNASPNRVEIYKWYRLAEMGGFQGATKRLAALDATMPEAEIVEARARVRAWQPATEGCPAGG